MSTENNTETSAQPDARVAESRIRVVEQFINTLTSCPEDREHMLVSLTGRMIIRSTVLSLWNTYLQGDFEENGFDKSQFDLLFHKHDAQKEPLENVTEILKLMVTGKKDGTLPKDGPINFFPSGFWTMPDVKWELTNQLHQCIFILLKAVCCLHFELPEDWEDEKHPENLYISLDDQIKTLSAALIERAGEIQMAEATSETSNEENEESESAVEESSTEENS